MRAVAAMGAGALLVVSAVVALITLASSFADRSDAGGVLVATLASLAAGALFVAHLQRTGGLVAVGLGLTIASAAAFDAPPETHKIVFVVAGGLVAALGGAALVVPPTDSRGSISRGRSIAIAVMCAVGASCLILRLLDAQAGRGWLALAVAVIGAGLAVVLAPDAGPRPDDPVVEVVSVPRPSSWPSSGGARPSRSSASPPASMSPPTKSARRPLSAPGAESGSGSMVSSSGSSSSSSLSEGAAPSTWLREIARAPSVAVRRASTAPEEDPLIGGRVGPYEVVSELGRGGMSVVYRARDTRSGAVVALKILPPSRANDRQYRSRFVREVAAMRGASHPGVVAVLEASPEDAPVFYLAMELVDGPSLRSALARRGRMEAREACAIVAAVARALGAAHAVGVVHRDVKPENILLAGGTAPKLADFGLARVDLRSGVKGATALTRAGDVLGTLAYMAPEQLRGEPAGPPADVFACGLVLGELIAGVPLVGRDTGEATMRALHEFKGLPDRVRALAPPAVARVLERALAIDPRARHADGAALAADLAST